MKYNNNYEIISGYNKYKLIVMIESNLSLNKHMNNLDREMDEIDVTYNGIDLSDLKKLTLVIPTFNRSYYLLRCLWYHAHFPFGEIIVADSSTDEIKYTNRCTIREINSLFGLNIKHLEYKPETEKYGGDIYKKWGDAVQQINTEYSELCTDKEFVIPTTIIEAIHYLDKHSEYGSYDGYYLNIKKKNDVYIAFKEHTERITMSDDEPIIRLLMSYTYQASSINLFAVKRTKLQKNIFKPLLGDNNSDIRFGETIIEQLTIIFSKYYHNSICPQKIRDVTNSVIHKKINKYDSSSSRYPLLDEYIRNNVYDYYFDSAVSCLSNALKEVTKDGRDYNTLVSWSLTPYLKKRGFFKSNAAKLYDKFSWTTKIMSESTLYKILMIINQNDTMTPYMNLSPYELLVIKIIKSPQINIVK